MDPTLVPSDDPRHEGWVIHSTLTKLLTNCNMVLFLFGGQKHELCSNVVHVQITCENCLHCSVWHINDCSNVLNGSLTILIHKPPNCFHIFRCWAHGRSPWPLVVFEWCSASLEACVRLETPHTTHGLISICTSYHFKSLRSRFAKFHAEFDVCSLLQFHVHAEIANVKAHVGHIYRKPETSIVKKIYKWQPYITRPVGRPKHRWDDIRNDLRKMKLLKWMEQAQDRQEWKKIVEKAKTLHEL